MGQDLQEGVLGKENARLFSFLPKSSFLSVLKVLASCRLIEQGERVEGDVRQPAFLAIGRERGSKGARGRKLVVIDAKALGLQVFRRFYFEGVNRTLGLKQKIDLGPGGVARPV